MQIPENFLTLDQIFEYPPSQIKCGDTVKRKRLYDKYNYAKKLYLEEGKIPKPDTIVGVLKAMGLVPEKMAPRVIMAIEVPTTVTNGIN